MTMVNDTFYQIWDTRGVGTPRVVDTVSNRNDARDARRKALRKNSTASSSDFRLVQLRYSDTGTGTIQFVR